MAEQSFLVDWSRVKNFWRAWNEEFTIQEMNGANNFQLVFSSYTPNNIDDCLTNSGTLTQDVLATSTVIDCGLSWDDNGIVSISNNVTWNIGHETIIPLKAIFLRKKENGFVLGYSINQTSFDVTNKVIVDKDTVIWSFHSGGAV